MFPPEGEKVATQFHVCGSVAVFSAWRKRRSRFNQLRGDTSHFISPPSSSPVNRMCFFYSKVSRSLSLIPIWPLTFAAWRSLLLVSRYRKWTRMGRKTQTSKKNNIWHCHSSRGSMSVLTHGPSVSSAALRFCLLWGAKNMPPWTLQPDWQSISVATTERQRHNTVTAMLTRISRKSLGLGNGQLLFQYFFFFFFNWFEWKGSVFFKRKSE